MLNNNLMLTLTRETKEGYKNGRINKEFLEKNIQDFSQEFYLCGPPLFTKEIKESLQELGADVQSLVF
jgi:ferredoxin-NADP reductase